MQQELIAEKIKERFPDEVLGVSSFRGDVSVTLRKDKIVEICQYLHDEPSLHFDYQVDLCGVDYMGRTPRFEVVYHLYSMRHYHKIRLRVPVGEGESVGSVSHIWKASDWNEREAYDLVGIRFTNHPDLRRILMPEDFKGHPLRKDFPLKGMPESGKV